MFVFFLRVNTVSKRLDSGDVKILNRALEKNLAQINFPTITLKSRMTVAKRCTRANFEQPKCFTNASPQRLVHYKMRYLETIAHAAFETLKEKFQYISDQLEQKSKQHQAVKGLSVS